METSQTIIFGHWGAEEVSCWDDLKQKPQKEAQPLASQKFECHLPALKQAHKNHSGEVFLQICQNTVCFLMYYFIG